MICPICHGLVVESHTAGRLSCTNDRCGAIILCVRMRPAREPAPIPLTNVVQEASDGAGPKGC